MKTTPQNILLLINQNKANPEIRSLAVNIIKAGKIKATDYPRVIESIADWVHNNIMFVRDAYNTDIMYPPIENIKMGYADCEDQTSLTATLLESLGIPTQVVIVSKRGDIWDHVFLKAGYPVDNPRYWIPVDTTITPPSGREISYAKKRIYSNYGYGRLGSPTIEAPIPIITVPIENRPILSYGSGLTEEWTEINNWVMMLQNYLIFLEYLAKLGLDGKFGDQTEAAIKHFQRDKNLSIDGIVGEETWTALDRAVAEKNIEIEKEIEEEEEKKEEAEKTAKFLDSLYKFIGEHKVLTLGAVGVLGLGIYLKVRK